MWTKVILAFALCLGCISIISESDLLSYKNRGKLEARICFKLSLPATNNLTAEFHMHTLPSSEFADTKNSLFADEHNWLLDAAARLIVLQNRVGNMQINSSFCATAHWSRALRFGRSQKCQRGRPAASLSRVSPVRRCLRRAAFRRSESGGVRPRRPACWRVPLRSARADSGDFQGSKPSSKVVIGCVQSRHGRRRQVWVSQTAVSIWSNPSLLLQVEQNAAESEEINAAEERRWWLHRSM